VWDVVIEIAQQLHRSWNGDAVFPILVKLGAHSSRPITEAAFASLNHASPLQ
jgi:hypothetical protein